MTNVVVLVGNAVKDVELKASQSNVNFVNFTIAVNRAFKNQNGERDVDYINVVSFRKTAELIAQYVHKGSKVAVSGRLQTRTYESDNGTRYITEVVCDNIEFLESKKQEEQTQEQSSDEFYETSKQLAQEEDLPF